jgi:hypothetical protein
MIPVAILAPSTKNEYADFYKKVGNQLEVSWIEMLALDTAKLKNDFKDIDNKDIMETGLEFILIDYSEYEEYEYDEYKWNNETKRPEKTGKKLTGTRLLYTKTYTGTAIKELMKDNGYDFVKSKHLKNFKKFKKKVEKDGLKSMTFTFFSLDQVASTQGFEDSDYNYMNHLIGSGVIAKKFGEFVELPEFIDVTSSGLFAFPTPYINKITDPYGYRNHPITGNYGFHTGLDIASNEGSAENSPIISSTSGYVSKICYGSGAYGYYVHVVYVDEQGVNWETRYCHMKQINVYEGQEVEQGTVLGAVGSTGQSTGPHLHFEILKNGSNVNPSNYIY